MLSEGGEADSACAGCLAYACHTDMRLFVHQDHMYRILHCCPSLLKASAQAMGGA